MLVVGPPGSGKSFRLARPMLSQLCGNFLVTDPKGELYKQTGQYFEDNGYEVMVMNVESEEGMPMSIHFNPFRYIRNESDIMSIAGILMKATTPQDEAGGGNDQFFEQSAEVLLTSLIYIMKEYIIEEERNWATFVKLLNATTVYTKADGSIDNRPGGILDIAKKAQLKWKKSHDSDFPGYIAIEKYYNGAAETTSSIVASLDAHCRYMKLQCVIDLLSEDEIKISESFGYSKKSDNSKTGKRILFIVTSEDKRYYDWIPSMVYSLFFDELYHLTAIDPKLHETLPHHLTFLMDEFANVTLPDSFVEKLSTMRSRNMSAVIIVQNLIQLKRKFPKFDMDKDLIGNCSIIDILGAPDMDSCEYLSKHFGTQTIHKASDSDAKDYRGSSSRSEDVMQKPLLSAEDIFAMKKDGECAIVIKGADPLYSVRDIKAILDYLDGRVSVEQILEEDGMEGEAFEDKNYEGPDLRNDVMDINVQKLFDLFLDRMSDLEKFFALIEIGCSDKYATMTASQFSVDQTFLNIVAADKKYAKNIQTGNVVIKRPNRQAYTDRDVELKDVKFVGGNVVRYQREQTKLRWKKLKDVLTEDDIMGNKSVEYFQQKWEELIKKYENLC